MTQETHTIPKTTCPECGYEMNCSVLVSGEGDEVPGPGALAVCAACAVPLFFRSDMTLMVIPLVWLQTMATAAPREYWDLMVIRAKIKTRLKTH